MVVSIEQFNIGSSGEGSVLRTKSRGEVEGVVVFGLRNRRGSCHKRGDVSVTSLDEDSGILC